MTVTIRVNENRTFSGAGRGFSFGTTFENDVTTLKFILPDSLNYLTERYLLLASGSDTFKLSLKDSNEVVIPQYVTTQDDIQIQLVLKDAKSGDIWRSATYDATFYPSLDEGSGDPIEVAKNQQREVDRLQLSETLAQLTESDLSGKTWDELIDVTAELPIKTEQDVVDLTSYTELTNAFRQAKTAPSLLTGRYNLDKDESNENILVKLPYLYTPNVKYSENTPISPDVVECGFDVSASGDTLCHYNEVSMFNGTNSARNLVKLKLTGFECVKYGKSMFMGVPELAELELVEGDNYPESYRPDYYNQFFRNCKKLEAIKGTPLDMSRGTSYVSMFYNCESLRYVRFKVGTICRDLDLSYCPALIKKYEATTDDPGTLLSIINGVRDYTGVEDPITIKFSTFVKSYLSSWRCTIDEQTGLYVYSDKNSENTMWTILTTAKGVVIS